MDSKKTALIHIPFPYNVIILIAGILFCYSAFFLYEDEEGILQNKLENWWLKLSYFSDGLISRHTLFVKKILLSVNIFIDKLFGKKIISFRACSLSLCLSFTSFGVVSFVFLETFRWQDIIEKNFNTSKEGILLITIIVVSFYFFLLIISLRINRHYQRRIWYGVIFSSIVLLLVYGKKFFSFIVKNEGNCTTFNTMDLTIGIIVGIIYDLFFVAIIRYILRWAHQFNSIIMIILIMIGNLILSIILFIVPILVVAFLDEKFALSDNGGSFHDFGLCIGDFISDTNIVSILFSLLFFCFGFVLLSHRVIWPILTRPIYAISRFGIFRHRKTLGLIGLSLITISFESISKLLHEIQSLFSMH